MKREDVRFFDAHVHFTTSRPIETVIAEFEATFAMAGTKKACFMSLTNSTDNVNNPKQNEYAMLLKRHFGGYAYAGLLYDESLDAAAQAEALVEQAKKYARDGFDGIKMMEGKPNIRRRFGRLLSDPVYDPFYSYMEKTGMPITLHNADPAIFWDREKVGAYAISRGWFADESLPSKDEMHRDVLRVMEKHPRLSLTLAHFGFLGHSVDEAELFLSRYENTRFDITPGGEQYFLMKEDVARWVAFLEKYAHRIKYGTDTGSLALDMENREYHVRCRADPSRPCGCA